MEILETRQKKNSSHFERWLDLLLFLNILTTCLSLPLLILHQEWKIWDPQRRNACLSTLLLTEYTM